MMHVRGRLRYGTGRPAFNAPIILPDDGIGLTM
jgi:hypothetical protein